MCFRCGWDRLSVPDEFLSASVPVLSVAASVVDTIHNARASDNGSYTVSSLKTTFVAIDDLELGVELSQVSMLKSPGTPRVNTGMYEVVIPDLLIAKLDNGDKRR